MTDWAGSAPPPEDWDDADTPRRNWLASLGYLATSKLYPTSIVDSLGMGLVLPSRIAFDNVRLGDATGHVLVLPPAGALQSLTRMAGLRDATSHALVLPVSANMLGSELVATPPERIMAALVLPLGGNIDTALLAVVIPDSVLATLQLPPSGNMVR